MLLLRKAIYYWQGGSDKFGNWPLELTYEYFKDARGYAAFFLIVGAYHLLMLRLQGEARLLTATHSGPPVEPIERPERFLLRKPGREFLLPANDVEWLQAMDNYLNPQPARASSPLPPTLDHCRNRIAARSRAIYVRASQLSGQPKLCARNRAAGIRRCAH